MRRRLKIGIGSIILSIILIFLIFYIFYSEQSAFNDIYAESENIKLNDSVIYVNEVIDGDTFILSNGEHVRLLCVDAPELDTEGGYEAKLYLENMILNEYITLGKDIDDKDKYGRLLRYVYVNDIFVNENMVKDRYASVFRYGNNTRLCNEI